VGINRRDLLKSITAVAGAGALCSDKAKADANAKNDPPSKPNVLVFLTDDHAQWLQEAYGNTEVQTPNLTRLARNGVRLSNAFTTCPICSPSRASFFTGRMPSQHGIHDWLDEIKQSYESPWLKDQTLISELLKEAGYHTGLVGKWHCGQDRYPHAGFDEWFTFWETQYPHAGKQNFSDNGKQLQVEGFQSSLFTDRAVSFLKSHRENATEAKKPFFLFISYTDTHIPHEQMPSDLVDRYQSATFRDIPVEPFPVSHGSTNVPISTDPAAEHAMRQQYYAAASSIDREVGRVLETLATLGYMDDTLIVYTSDHGLNAGQHGMWEKGNATSPQNFFDESIRIPCTLSWPAGEIPRGLDCDLPVNHCDLFATVLDAAGATPAAATAKKINSPGQSYLSHLRGKPEGVWRDSVICEYGNARMMRQDGYKLILRYPYNGVHWASEFYDLKADPRETTNLYANPSAEYSRIIARMSKAIDDYFVIYTVPEHDGMHLETQPVTSTFIPWLQPLEPKK